MAQHDMDVANQTFPNTRPDINAALVALASNSIGGSAPATKFTGQFWIDSNTSPQNLLKLWDGVAFTTIGQWDTTNDRWVPVGQFGFDNYIVAGGTVDALTGSIKPAPAAYQAGMALLVKAAGANTGAATFNLNGLGAKSIKRPTNAALQAGDLVTNLLAILVYDLSLDVFILTNPTSSTVSAASETVVGIVELATPAEQRTATDDTRAATPKSVAAVASGPRTDINAASTTDLSTILSTNVRVVGNTNIDSFGTVASGVRMHLEFTGTPQLNYNATSMILFTGASIQVQAGDTAVMESLGSGNWKMLQFSRFTGMALVGSGEANTMSSAGGTSLVKTKSGVDLPIKGLTGGTVTVNINHAGGDVGNEITNVSGTGTLSIVSNTNDLQINATITLTLTHSNSPPSPP